MLPNLSGTDLKVANKGIIYQASFGSDDACTTYKLNPNKTCDFSIEDFGHLDLNIGQN